MAQKHCSSCGSPIPDGQGNSCSMCYGDIAYGNDGYYEQWARQQEAIDERNRPDYDQEQPEPDLENYEF
jgi:hypothetical protein